MVQSRNPWRRPATVIAAAGVVLSLGGGFVSWQREHEREQESRLSRLEQRDAVTNRALVDNQDAILARLDGLREGLSSLRDSLRRENDGIERRVEALERRR
jgi:uncharacterized protein HemX